MDVYLTHQARETRCEGVPGGNNASLVFIDMQLPFRKGKNILGTVTNMCNARRQISHGDLGELVRDSTQNTFFGWGDGNSGINRELL